MNNYYTYAYLREDGTPYYVGKGEGYRAYKKRKIGTNSPKDKTKIILLKQNLTEKEAFKHEKYMIAIFGRIDLGTGILRNRTDGGEGSSGFTHSEETKGKMSKLNKGENNPSYGKRGKNSPLYGKSHSEETKKKMSEKAKGRCLSYDTKRKLSEANKGENNYWYGKSHSEQTKRKMSEAQKGENNHNYGKSASNETKRKISEAKKGENNPAYGTKWWNDGCGNIIRSKECPEEGWVLGRIKI
jgi:hypothetical protein